MDITFSASTWDSLHHPVLDKFLEDSGLSMYEHLETFAAAYCMQTDIPPNQAVLVHYIKSDMNGIKDIWYFTEKIDKRTWTVE